MPIFPIVSYDRLRKGVVGEGEPEVEAVASEVIFMSVLG
jgi:hypothetical protein